MDNCITCKKYSPYPKTVSTLKQGDGCCNDIDAAPIFKKANEKSFHPFKMFVKEVKSCQNFIKGVKDEASKDVPAEAFAQGKGEAAVS